MIASLELQLIPIDCRLLLKEKFASGQTEKEGSMSDFFQPGVITTLHRFKRVNQERMELELEFHSKHNPIALVLPSSIPN